MTPDPQLKEQEDQYSLIVYDHNDGEKTFHFKSFRELHSYLDLNPSKHYSILPPKRKPKLTDCYYGSFGSQNGLYIG